MGECDDCIELVDAEVCDGCWCRHRGHLAWSVVLVLTGGVGGAWSCGVWPWLGGGCWGCPSCVGGVPVAVGCGPVVALSRVVRALTGWGLSVGVRVRLRPGVGGCPAQTSGPGTTRASPPQ